MNINGNPIYGLPSVPTPTTASAATAIATKEYVDTYIPTPWDGSSTSGSAVAIPAPASTLPLMDGTASQGISLDFARADHVHPENLLKANLDSPIFTGTPAAPTPTTASGANQIATKGYVDGILAANDAMIFKGTLGFNGTTATLPATHKIGWTYRIISAGSYADTTCEIGDLIICVADGTSANNADWTVVQTNIDGSVIGPASSTGNHIATFSGVTGKIIQDSGFTIATSVPANAVFTDTTYTSEVAANGGTAVSLCTTGEKYIWNNKANASSVVTQANIDSNGLINFKNSNGTVQFTVQLPLYNGEEV